MPSAIDTDRLVRETFIARAEHYATVGSTNDLARERAAEGRSPLPLLIVADEQTAGRGRGANRWWTGVGSLACSLLLDADDLEDKGSATREDKGSAIRDKRSVSTRKQPAASLTPPPSPVVSHPLLSLAAAVAIVDTVAPRLPSRTVGLHWPNDVFVEGRKLAGILVEMLSVTEKGTQLLCRNGGHRPQVGPGASHKRAASPFHYRRAIVGIGLNANNSLRDAPQPLPSTATTLFELTGVRHDATQILFDLLGHLARGFGRLGPAPEQIAARADDLLLQRGQSLAIESGGRLVRGRCAGIDLDGALLLDTAQGRRKLYSGVLRE